MLPNSLNPKRLAPCSELLNTNELMMPRCEKLKVTSRQRSTHVVAKMGTARALLPGSGSCPVIASKKMSWTVTRRKETLHTSVQLCKKEFGVSKGQQDTVLIVYSRIVSKLEAIVVEYSE